MSWLTTHWSEVALIVSEILGLAGFGGIAKIIKDAVSGKQA
jgi:uncharacterized membrane protein YtjA (UPF0391 family)